MQKILIAAIVATVSAAVPVSAAAAEPTCTAQLETETHGEHVLYDYVAGVGHDSDVAWPPSGTVGDILRDEQGALLPGAPGQGHMSNGFAPGASFCTGSSSPGTHL